MSVTLVHGSMVSKSMAARARRWHLSERQCDSWARHGLIDPPLSGDGRKRAWEYVSDRRLAACSLVMYAASSSTLPAKRKLVDELDSRGVAVVQLSTGRIVLELHSDLRIAA